MLDLYNYNGIEIHIFVTELNKYELIDISYKTHPEWRVVDAIHSSCCIPIMFSPIVKDDCCYIDGGFLLNYPISKCLENLEKNAEENIEEIFGISLANYNMEDIDSKGREDIIRENSNIFDLLNVVIHKSLHNIGIFSNDKTNNIPYQIHQTTQPTTLDYGFAVLYNKEERQSLIESGINTMNQYLVQWFS
jgi:NTE family protein